MTGAQLKALMEALNQIGDALGPEGVSLTAEIRSVVPPPPMEQPPKQATKHEDTHQAHYKEVIREREGQIACLMDTRVRLHNRINELHTLRKGDAAVIAGYQRRSIRQTEEINRLRRELRGLEAELKDAKKKGFAIPKRKIQIVFMDNPFPDPYTLNQRPKVNETFRGALPNTVDLFNGGLRECPNGHSWYGWVPEPTDEFRKAKHHQTFEAPYPSGRVCDYGHAKPFFAHSKVYKIAP